MANNELDDAVRAISEALLREATRQGGLPGEALSQAARLVDQLSMFEVDARKGRIQRSNLSRYLVKVFLNDVELRNCIAADDCRGIALVIRTDLEGRPLTCPGSNYWSGDEAICDTLYGEVRIEPVSQ